MFKTETHTLNMLKKNAFTPSNSIIKQKQKNIHTAPTGYAFPIRAIGEVRQDFERKKTLLCKINLIKQIVDHAERNFYHNKTRYLNTHFYLMI